MNVNSSHRTTRWCHRSSCYAWPVAVALFATSSTAASAECLSGATSTLLPAPILRVRTDAIDLSAPARLATDAAGNLYVTDPSRGALVVRSGDGEVLAVHSGLGSPTGVAVDGAGRIYVGEATSGSVTVHSPEWQALFQLGQGAGEFVVPTDIDIDSRSGAVWVADGPANKVNVYDAAGNKLRSLDGGGRFDFPAAVFVNSVAGAAGEALIVDQQAHRVQVYDLQGNYLSCLGSGGSGSGTLVTPQGIWADSNGRIYVADSFQGWVKVLDRSGNEVGSIGDFGDGLGQLRLPLDVAIDRWNRLIVASANTSRLEIFELASDDPVLPAAVTAVPDPLYRGLPQPSVSVLIEVAGGDVRDILASSVSANGVAANAASAQLGDRDGDATPDLELAFDWAALVATLPEQGAAVVTVTGAIAGGRFEGSGSMTVVAPACDPGIVCALGDQDPRCNESVCVEPSGCSVRALVDGASCQDGDPCTVGDACEQGACLPGTPDGCQDGNACTDDSCIAGVGCTHANNTASCEDGDACTTGDVCCAGICGAGQVADCDDGNPCTADSCRTGSGCTHLALSGTGVACDDGDLTTVDDVCVQAGVCRGSPATVRYGVARWSAPGSTKAVRLTAASDVLLEGSACADRISVNSGGYIGGDLIALAQAKPVVLLGTGTVQGDVVTGNGATATTGDFSVGGRVDTTGTGPELSECGAAATVAAARWLEFLDMPVSSGSAARAVAVRGSATTRIPSEGTLGAGTVVVDTNALSIGEGGALVVVGGEQTSAVVVRVRGAHAALTLGRRAHVQAESLRPEQLLFVVDGDVRLQTGAVLAGTVLASGSITLAPAASVDGALFGGERIRLGRGVGLRHSPFVGW